MLATMGRGLRAGVAVALLLTAVGCGGGDDGDGAGEEIDRAERASLPERLEVFVDQGRLFRMTRTAYVRLTDEDPDRSVTVSRALIRSERFDEVEWRGEKTFVNGADLKFEVPRGRCGEGGDAEVTLTYRLDDGPWRESTAVAPDRYGALDLFLDRDCAESTLAEAARLELGEPRVVGTGRGSVWELPVAFAPTGERDDVAFAGFQDTVLFRQVAGSAAAGRRTPLPLAGEPVEVLLRLVPTRCDPHALAEDKVGTLVAVDVLAPGLEQGASFFLLLGDERRAGLRGFFATHCGL